MENIKRINNQLAIAMGQLTSDQLQQSSQEGFKSVLNLRSPNEAGFLPEEQQQAENAGLQYVNLPVNSDQLSDEVADQVLQKIDQLPKPTLIHCKSGMRSSAMALMYVATQQGMNADEAIAMGKQMGFDYDSSPQMKQFFEHYVSAHNNFATTDDNDRVRAHTSPQVNAKIDQEIADTVREYAAQPTSNLSKRLQELGREWDTERVLEANASILAFLGLMLGIFVNSNWFWLTGIVLPFLLQHAVQGWCPPL